MIQKWLSPQFFDKKHIATLHKSFKEKKPFPHLLIENFLLPAQAKKLASALKTEPFQKKQSDLFSLSQTQDFIATPNVALKECYALFQDKEFTQAMSAITGLKLKKKVDMAGSLYEDTDYLLCHDDELEGRRIAYIYYLSPNFKESDGGALVLLADEKGNPGHVIQRYAPRYNGIIIFEVSPKSWHEVEEVLKDKKRYAIGGWLY